ncbi:hypothetical protein COO60DRAFT_1015035 [Scenedesmus sp. NREL 46B-D3]|nr:hypothetical protein COO60DRAFT_1015035 [Scenedesmus sp. NREL 46B-D3]
MLSRLKPLWSSLQWCNVAAAAQHALHTSVAVAQAEAAVAQQGNVQDALDALRKRMAQGPELGDFVTGKELTDVYSLEAPGYKVGTQCAGPSRHAAMAAHQLHAMQSCCWAEQSSSRILWLTVTACSHAAKLQARL